MGVRLPAEYQEVKYLESTGTQYINTEIVASPDCGFRVVAQTETNRDENGLIGVLNNNWGTNQALAITTYNYSGTNYVNLWYGSYHPVPPIPVAKKTIFSVNYKNDKNGYVDNTSVALSTATIVEFPIYLFALNRTSSAGTGGYFSLGAWKIYNAKITNQDEIVRDMIPCYRKSDSVAGMYDLVSETFFVNQGTGEFLVGPDVKYGLPAEYQEVEYIQGRLVYNPAYIDTLYIPTVNTKLRVKFSPDNQNQYGFFGARGDPYRFYCATFSLGSQLSCGMTVNTWPLSRVATVFGRIYDCTIANGQSEINGNIVSTPVISAENWSESVGTIQLRSLFVGQYDQDSTAKYYLCQIWENDVLVRDFVPCYRKSDNEPGMYDLVTGTFFTNAGTGEFVVGAEVHRTISPRLMDRRRALIAKLTSLFRRVITSQTGLVTFDTNVEKPMKVACEFSPVQDLHGYDHPWPAGGGKNLIPGFDNTTFWNTNGFIRSNGTITSSDIYRTSDYLTITPNSTYAYVSHGSDGGRQWRGVLAYDSEKSPIESSFRELQGADLIFTTPENAAYLRLYSKIGEGFYAQLELGSTATAYEPYENICPISGWTDAEIKQTGKNLLNIHDDYITRASVPGTYVITENTISVQSLTSGNAYCGFIVPVKIGQTYTYSSTNNKRVTIAQINAPVSEITGPETFGKYVASGSSILATSPYFLVNFVAKNSPLVYENPQLELGTTNTQYESYQVTTIPINWQTEAGTLYGGTVTINPDGSADVVKTHSKCVLSTLSWTENSSVANTYNSSIGDRARSVYEWGIKAISDRYKQYSSMGLGPPAYGFALGFSGDLSNTNIYVKDSSTTSLSDFVDMITETGTYVVYPLATLQSYHFDNIEQLQSFLDTNNVWHNMNGPITVEYYKKQQ